jgi:membrane-bound hydrogenase subunit beta
MTDVVEKLQSHLKSDFLEAKLPRKRRVFVRVGVASIREAVRYAILELGFDHLGTITGSDLGGEMEVIYHLIEKGTNVLSLSVRVPKEKATVPDISDIVPSAVIYEREVHELVGINFEGLQDSSHLLLPEGWPDGVFPLKKDTNYGMLNEIKLKKGC